MSSDSSSRLRERIRAVRAISDRPLTRPAPLALPGGGLASGEELEATLGGRWINGDAGRCLVTCRRYEPTRRHGTFHIGECAAVLGAHQEALRLVLTGSPAPPSDPGILQRDLPQSSAPSGARVALPLVFLDIETTGLSGGAGTQAFLVGCGRFEGDAFHARQFFLSSYAEERAVLAAVLAEVGADGTIVTFNGKAFDLPVLETRYLFHRLDFPWTGASHLDMLHLARRLWRPRERDSNDSTSCNLASLERALLGFPREEDVAGVEIPAHYFRYIRSGDAIPLAAVFEHNRLDLLSLAGLTMAALRLVEGGAEKARDARECLGLGRLYERACERERAAACYARVAGCAWDERPFADVDPAMQADALHRLALQMRRDRRDKEAAIACERILALDPCPRRIEKEASRALAVYHEHKRKDLQAARLFAVRALHSDSDPRWQTAGLHRLGRLDRKLAATKRRGGVNVADPAPSPPQKNPLVFADGY